MSPFMDTGVELVPHLWVRTSVLNQDLPHDRNSLTPVSNGDLAAGLTLADGDLHRDWFPMSTGDLLTCFEWGLPLLLRAK